MAAIDSHLPERVSELLSKTGAKASEFLAACVAFIMQLFSAVPPFLSRHASAINSHARTHVWPVVQPHWDRISAEAKTRTAPAVAWAEENIAPTYRDLQRQFEVQTEAYSHLQIAAVAGIGCLLVYWVVGKLLSWLTSEPDQPASQRRATFVRSLPGVRGIVEKERAKVRCCYHQCFYLPSCVHMLTSRLSCHRIGSLYFLNPTFAMALDAASKCALSRLDRIWKVWLCDDSFRSCF